MKERKINYSVFHIVINSNRDLNEEDKTHFMKAGNYLFGKRTNLLRYIEAHRHRNDDNDDINSHLKKIEVTMGYEKGAKFHKDHLDVTLSITHDSCIKMKNKDLKDFFCKVIGGNIHLDVKACNDNKKYLEQYSSKEGEISSFSL
jgi:hypothetical protein